MKCHECKREMKLSTDMFHGIEYEHYVCACGEDILDSLQLQKLGIALKAARKAKEVKLTKWGNSMGVRIPKQYIKDLGLTEGQPVSIHKDEKGLRIIPE